jgi:hypothetical protein
MAVVFDARTIGVQNSSASTPQTFSHTCTGSNRFLAVAILCGNASSKTFTVTYNSVSCTQAVTNFNDARQAVIFYLENPASGSNTVSVSWDSGTLELQVVAISYTGVKQTSSLDTTTTGTALSDNITTGVNNALIIDANAFRDATTITGVGASQTSRLQNSDPSPTGSPYGGISDKIATTAGSYSMSWTTSGGEGNRSHSLASFIPASTQETPFLLFL